MNLELSGVRLSLGKFTLDIPDLSVSGNTVGIAGPNGSGKSTFLKLIDGLIGPESGTVTVNGNNVLRMPPMQRARLISYLPQEIPTPFAFRAIDVVKLSGYSAEENESRALECMEMLEIDHLACRDFNSLSGGEKRLAMLAGMIYQNSDIILMDEPETYLDVKHKVMLRRAVRKLASEGKSFITVIHDLDGLSRSTEMAILMKNGKVMHHGQTPDVVNEKNLAEIFSVKFLKDVNSVENRYVALDETE